MNADTLIALEGVFAELGDLYIAARQFTALRADTERELLPSLTNLGSRLRHLVRHQRLQEAELEQTGAEILDLRSRWLARMAALRSSEDYQRAKTAVAAGAQREIATMIPRIFAGLAFCQRHDLLYFPVPITTGRRRPGAAPFLRATEVAERISTAIVAGLTAQSRSDDWWDQDFPSLTCADEPDAFETPVTLAFAPPTEIALFGVEDEPLFRLFAPHLPAVAQVALAAAVEEEWWETNPEPYPLFRQRLSAELVAREIALLPSQTGSAT